MEDSGENEKNMIRNKRGKKILQWKSENEPEDGKKGNRVTSKSRLGRRMEHKASNTTN